MIVSIGSGIIAQCLVSLGMVLTPQGALATGFFIGLAYVSGGIGVGAGLTEVHTGYNEKTLDGRTLSKEEAEYRKNNGLESVITSALAMANAKLTSEINKQMQSSNASNSNNQNTEGSSGTEKWTNPDGTVNYPPNNGAIPGTEVKTTLQPGKLLGRYGDPTSTSHFLTEAGADPNTLALPPNTNSANYHTYEVIREIPGTTQSKIMDWAGSTGGGYQFDTLKPIQWYLDNGYLIER